MTKHITRNNKGLVCPSCGLRDVGLWNSRKQTYHCHKCDCYFNKYGTLLDGFNEPRQNIGRRSKWNGFTDPDDFPTDGFSSEGW